MSREAGDCGFLDSCISGSRIRVFQLIMFGKVMMISLSRIIIAVALEVSMKQSRKLVRTMR